MIHILILIGKIIGITILSLFGLLLILLILLLLVPIRYHVLASKEAQIVAKVNVSWLLHIVSMTWRYKEDSNIILKLFGIQIYNEKRKAEKAMRKEEKEARKADKKPARTQKEEKPGKTLESESEEKQIPPIPKQVQAIQEAPLEQKIEEDEEPKQTFWKKIKQFLQALLKKCINIKYTIREICDKIKKAVTDVESYLELLQSEEFKSAYDLCKEQLFRLWNHIKPTKYQVYLHIGTEDPSTLGSIMACYGMFYPLHKGHIVLQPNFEQIILEGNMFVKGRITLLVLLRAAWIIYFNKNIRRILALLKKEEL